VSAIKKVIQEMNWYNLFEIIKIDLINCDYKILYG